ncbi:translation initiation factor IF-2 [Carboxylicivirga linearis]|uniref:Translation initiation factor IF-2 n=1 Tax=Carboxylicivirga linearis TaxID=1628157 RepID=A0ABS5JSC9_9BACT|nr:translation initiation factor IF-2 [Carboxylicivirga linearis]MBS2097762.1 translation initiation factor IF-2 [Carboxylicivirga linearis]
MAVGKRLSKVAREFNVGISTIVEFLHKKGYKVEGNPNTKVSEEMYSVLAQEYRSDSNVKKESEKLTKLKDKSRKESISIEDVRDDLDSGSEKEEEAPAAEERKVESKGPKVVGKIDLNPPKKAEPKKEAPKAEAPKEEAPKKEAAPKPVEAKKEEPKAEKPVEEKPKVAKKPEHIPTKVDPVAETKVVGKIDLNPPKKETPKAETPKAETPKAEAPKEEAPKKEQPKQEAPKKEVVKKETPKVEKKPKVVKKEEQPKEAKAEGEKKEGDESAFRPTQVKKLSGPTVVGKIDLPTTPTKSEGNKENVKKRKRKRIKKDKEKVDINQKQQQPQGGGGDNKKPQGERKDRPKRNLKVKKRPQKAEINEEDVQKQIKDTLARLTSKGKSKGAKHRREKREAQSQRQQADLEQIEKEKSILKVTEFVTANELANMMDVQVNQIISTCMSLGMFVSINQRLDAETLSLVAEEFGYTIEFVSADVAESIIEEEDKEEDMISRPPIVTVMGHVDHGKTSLLDHIRKANVIAGEAGGITQHIGAYSVKIESGRQITFLDTPGHEAFTAMRARGAQITDIAIIIVAADDNVMPQTVEAINHASAAGVPIVFAINKIDKPGANPDRIREELANMNYLVEDWGGKYQCQEISAKNGVNIEDLLEKVLLEADLLELKADPKKRAVGSVIESSLDKGRGFVTTLLVQGGTLRVGDMMLSGSHIGHVKAMFNERNQKVEAVGPSEPALVLGLNGAPQAGERINVMEDEREAKDIATKREQLQREQGMRTKKHITLDEIGRRIAIGNFQELNVIVKGDVDGSIEALSDSLIKLSTEEIQVNVIHKAVGQISESDIMLAAASNAIVVGFQVRPSLTARRIAEKEEIDIRLYSIIYDAIEELKSAMEGMLSPEIKEQITATVEIREVFKISKVGTIAGCMVKEGKIKRTNKIRVIREGIVVYTGELGSLKRFKDDVKEVATGYECGLNIEKFNDIKVGDVVEAYEEVEVSRKL